VECPKMNKGRAGTVVMVAALPIEFLGFIAD
jgi:hypothetical protein